MTHLRNVGTGADAMKAGSWYDDAYYQILLVEPLSDGEQKQNPGKHIKTTIVVGQRKKETLPYHNFSLWKLDNKSKNDNNPQPPDFQATKETIAAYLPSFGVVFPQGFIDTLTRDQIWSDWSVNNILYHHSIEINNFYETTRTLLHNRKTSQLIAKTWYAYLTAKKSESETSENNLLTSFTKGQWGKLNNLDPNILDGLIAREIFLLDQNSSPDKHQPDNLDIYHPLKSQYGSDKTRFLILPNSKGWDSLALSLLLSGHAYYKADTNGEYQSDGTYYHRISQPILSTGEIVIKYGLEVSWDRFKGDIKELGIRPGNNSIAYAVTIPYPPIPSEHNLSLQDIEEWAYAEDEPNKDRQSFIDPSNTAPKFPFYHTQNSSEGDKYLVDVQYFSPPYPYLPLSCS